MGRREVDQAHHPVASPGSSLFATTTSAGMVSLVYGRATFPTARFDLRLRPPPAWHIAQLVGEEDESTLGFAVVAAGDLNQDGYDDLLLGSPAMGCYAPLQGVGRTYVVLGAPRGLWGRPYVGVSPVAAVADQIYEGAPAPYDHTGVSVSVAGWAGASWTRLSSPYGALQQHGPALMMGTGADAAWVIPYDAGERTVMLPDIDCEKDLEGFLRCRLVPLLSPRPRPLRVDLASATGIRIEGDPGSVLGQSVLGAGDLDADGTPDLVIGATGQFSILGDRTGSSGVLLFRGK